MTHVMCSPLKMTFTFTLVPMAPLTMLSPNRTPKGHKCCLLNGTSCNNLEKSKFFKQQKKKFNAL